MPRSLRIRLVVGLIIVLLAAQILQLLVRDHFILVGYEEQMQVDASLRYAQQVEALLADPNAALPAPVGRPFRAHDVVWRGADSTLLHDETFGSQFGEDKARERLVEVGIVPTELAVFFGSPYEIDAILGQPSDGAQSGSLPMETLFVGQFAGIDGAVFARFRAGPAPPMTQRWDVFRTFLITAVLGSITILFVSRELGRSMNALQSAADGVGRTKPVTKMGEGEFSEVQPVFDAFDRMSGRVADKLRDKDVLLGALGHDLRSPLATLRLTLDMQDPSGDRDRMIAATERIDALLSDILELASSEHLPAPSESFNVSQIVQEVVQENHELGRDVTFDGPHNALARCRPNSVRRMIQNLVGNAVTYAGKAVVSVARDGDFVRISILDDGPGLPEEELAKITDPFNRGGRTGKAGRASAGLGLALARAVALSHGGQLTIKNRASGGLLVQVTCAV